MQGCYVFVVGLYSIAASAITQRMSLSSYLNLKPEQPSLTKQLLTQPTGNVIQITEILILNIHGQQFGTIETDSAEDRIVLIGDLFGKPQAAMSIDEEGRDS
ncbi:MAG: hypothetical protein VX910_01135 [Candidatus Latescibacterota bacterium]|nr:hypothetical protein [Candidatus Latescibacterota bacterium]